MSGKIYHKRANKNCMASEELAQQKKEIFNFIDEKLKTPNLAIFIGSGCSVGVVPLMSYTMKEILKSNQRVLEVVKAYCNKKPVKLFIDYVSNKSIDSTDILNSIQEVLKSIPENEACTLDKVVKKLKKTEHDAILQVLDDYYLSFGDIESLLNWIQSGLNYEPNNKKLRAVFFSLKEKFIETIPEFSADKYVIGSVAENYRKFYKKIFGSRVESQSKVSIFTTNYDLFNEYALEVNNISYTTGFKSSLTQSFDINEFNYRTVDDTNRYKDKWQPVKKEANLFKLHGSINWYTDEKNNFYQSSETNGSTEHVVIYPTMLKHKETAQSPYSELFREFSNRLQERNTTLFVMGYGFPDEHINTIIAQNLRNTDFNLVVFGDETEEKLKLFMEEFGTSNNFHVIGGDVTEQEKAHYFNFIVNELLYDSENKEVESDA